MKQFDTFSEYMFDLLFAPLKKGRKTVNQLRIFFKVMGREFDDLKAAIFRVRSEANVASCSEVMLPVHGQDRDMPRLEGEDAEAYRTRLSMKGIISQWSGTRRGVLYALTALGYPKGTLEVDLIQMVRMVEDGKEVKMSKRTGNAITLRELCEDIGVDAARWFFVSKDVATHMDLDLKLARSKDNNNPVYYAQYAYSRMCSILKNPQIPEFKPVDSYDRLTDEKELQLLKMISEFPKEVAADALNRKPNKMTEYIITLVKVFHSYYNSTKVNNPDDPELTNERIGLIKAAMITLKNALTLIGVSAPESM